MYMKGIGSLRIKEMLNKVTNQGGAQGLPKKSFEEENLSKIEVGGELLRGDDLREDDTVERHEDQVVDLFKLIVFLRIEDVRGKGSRNESLFILLAVEELKTEADFVKLRDAVFQNLSCKRSEMLEFNKPVDDIEGVGGGKAGKDGHVAEEMVEEFDKVSFKVEALKRGAKWGCPPVFKVIVTEFEEGEGTVFAAEKGWGRRGEYSGCCGGSCR